MTDPESLTVPQAIDLLKSIVISVPDFQAASEADLSELMRVCDLVDGVYTAAADELDRREQQK